MILDSHDVYQTFRTGRGSHRSSTQVEAKTGCSLAGRFLYAGFLTGKWPTIMPLPENEECGHVVVKVSHYYKLCSYIFKSIIVNSVLG